MLGEKNLLRHEWINDERPLCVKCQYATWGWCEDEFCKRRFVNGCIKTFNERGNQVTIGSLFGFDPAIYCDGYEKVEFLTCRRYTE